MIKAEMFSTSIDGHARVTLLRSFDKEPRLLAAVDQLYYETEKNQTDWRLNVTFKGNKRRSTRRMPDSNATRNASIKTLIV